MADFSPGALAKAVHATLDEAQAAIPAGHRRALIVDATYAQADGAGVRAMYVERIKGQWIVVVDGAYNGTDGLSAGAKVAWSGK